MKKIWTPSEMGKASYKARLKKLGKDHMAKMAKKRWEKKEL